MPGACKVNEYLCGNAHSNVGGCGGILPQKILGPQGMILVHFKSKNNIIILSILVEFYLGMHNFVPTMCKLRTRIMKRQSDHDCDRIC